MWKKKSEKKANKSIGSRLHVLWPELHRRILFFIQILFLFSGKSISDFDSIEKCLHFYWRILGRKGIDCVRWIWVYFEYFIYLCHLCVLTNTAMPNCGPMDYGNNVRISWKKGLNLENSMYFLCLFGMENNHTGARPFASMKRTQSKQRAANANRYE